MKDKKTCSNVLVVAIVSFLLGGLTTYVVGHQLGGVASSKQSAYIGSKNAKVEFVEYSSLACKHCKEVRERLFPKIKSEFVDTGKVKYVFKPFINNPASVNAALLMDCVRKDKYYALADALYANQEKWIGKEASLHDLKMAAGNIFTEEQFNACVQDEARKQIVVEAFRAEATAKGLRSSPSYLVNGEKVLGNDADLIKESINLALQGKSLSEITDKLAKEALVIKPNDRVMGNANAPVTIIEYASLSCPHCAKFHTGILPEVKKQYIETGKAKLVYRDLPLNAPALNAAKITRCADPANYYSLVSILFENQNEWAVDKEKETPKLKAFVAKHGVDAAAFDACIANTDIEKQILTTASEARKIGVSATPSFFLNGKMAEHVHTVDEFRHELDRLLGSSKH